MISLTAVFPAFSAAVSGNRRNRGAVLAPAELATIDPHPVQNVTIADCDFGTPADVAQPYYLYNVQGLTLDNVTIGGTIYNTTLSA